MCPITDVPIHHKGPHLTFFVLAYIANKQNSTAETWGLGAQFVCVRPELARCVH